MGLIELVLMRDGKVIQHDADHLLILRPDLFEHMCVVIGPQHLEVCVYAGYKLPHSEVQSAFFSLSVHFIVFIKL